MQSITSADSTHPHISSHIFIRYSFSSDFLGLAVKLLSNSICFLRLVAAYWLFEAPALVMREISFLSLSAAKPLLTGTRAGSLWGYLETHTHTRLAGRARSERVLSLTYLQTAVIQICALGLAQHTTTSLLDTLVWTGGWSGRGWRDSVWMCRATNKPRMEGRQERGPQSQTTQRCHDRETEMRQNKWKEEA